MDNMINHNFFRFIFLLLLFHLFKEEAIINNPIIISDHPNPIILYSSTNYIILTSGQVVYVNKETGIIDSSYNFCEYSFPYVLGSTESGKRFIYSSQNFCEFTLPNTFRNYTDNSLIYSDNSNYIGYIQENEYMGNAYQYRYCRCAMSKDEIIIYGKKESGKIILTYVNQLRKSFIIDTQCPYLEDKMICKKLLNSYYSCASICQGEILLYLFTYLTKTTATTTNCEMSYKSSLGFPDFKSHTNIEVYGTSDNTIDLICAKNINSLEIECFLFKYIFSESISSYQCIYTVQGAYKGLFSFTSSEEANGHNCDITSLDSENLFCCGGINFIKCQRLNSLWETINTFNLNLQGKNNNIYILTTSSSFVSIFYVNEDSNQKVCEYIIFFPKCENKQYTIISFHSINEDKSEENKETINNYFTRKINTNYYIEFVNMTTEYGDLSINNEIIDENTGRILIEENNENIIDFISTNENIVDNFEIKYKIIIDETFSSECKIDLTILPCYKSCSRCTKDSSSSNPEDHNCIEDKCKPEYYKDPTKNTNCFKISEKKTNWYFDDIEKKFGICNILCASCNGPLDNNCIGCYSINDDPNHAFLFNNKCIDSFPEGTYKIEEPEGYYRGKFYYFLNVAKCGKMWQMWQNVAKWGKKWQK